MFSPGIGFDGWKMAGAMEIDAGIEYFPIEGIHKFGVLLRNMDVAKGLAYNRVILAFG